MNWPHYRLMMSRYILLLMGIVGEKGGRLYAGCKEDFICR
jgi:hypothetical protein